MRLGGVEQCFNCVLRELTMMKDVNGGLFKDFLIKRRGDVAPRNRLKLVHPAGYKNVFQLFDSLYQIHL